MSLKALLLNLGAFLLPLCIVAQSATARAKAEAYLDSAYTKYSIYSLEGQRCADTALMIDPTFAAAWQQKAMPHLKTVTFRTGLNSLTRRLRLILGLG